MEHAKRFRALLADLGLSHADAAKFLHVSLRTLHNWFSGTHQVPFATFKVLRMVRHMELPGESWAGWSFSRGQLVTPEGRCISGKDGSWWTLLVRQGVMFKKLYYERLELQRQLASLRLTIVSPVVHEGLVELAMECGLPSTGPAAELVRTSVATGGASSVISIEVPVTLQSSLTGEIPGVSVESAVTPQPSPVDRKNYLFAGRLVYPDLARFVVSNSVHSLARGAAR